MAICNCLVTSPPPPTSCSGSCIYAPNMLVTNVTACDGVSTILLSDKVVTVCNTSEVSYTIVKTENVSGVSITEDSILFTPVNNDYAEGIIKYRIRCGFLSRTGTIIVVYENNCINNCDTNEVCNKCTGNCEPLPPDLFTSSSDPDLLT